MIKRKSSTQCTRIQLTSGLGISIGNGNLRPTGSWWIVGYNAVFGGMEQGVMDR